jgi:hypothetical protein
MGRDDEMPEVPQAPFYPWGGRNAFYDGDEEHDEVHVPEPGWNQQPGDFNGVPNFDPTTRWGGVQLAVIAPNVLGGNVPVPQLQVMQTLLKIPAVCNLRLSAQQLDLAVLNANDTVTWTVIIGVGEASQTRFYKKQISPVDGSVDNDIFLVLPIQGLSITAVVTLHQDATLERRCQLAAQLAARSVTFGNVR